jgi:molecular chaperone GrpE
VSRAHFPEEPERVVIRDNRKIDPKTGEARKRSGDANGADKAVPTAPTAPTAAPVAEEGERPVVDAALLDERTADLQRLQAEYANYRKRAERERLAAGDLAVGRVLGEFLPVLDDLDRAAAHGDLEAGPLKAIADKLAALFDKLRLEPFGAVGDRFDPMQHEAVMHDESDEFAEPTCTSVLRKGYRYRDRLLRPAMVAVTDPATASDTVAEETPSTNGAQSDEESAPRAGEGAGEPTTEADHSETPASPIEDGAAAQSEPATQGE